MGYKRQEINGVTPQDLKNLNDNIRYLWLKVFGNIDTVDLSDGAVTEKKLSKSVNNTIASKVNNTDFQTTISQTNQAISLKASQSSLDTTNQRVTDAESSLTVQANQIATKVDVNGVKSTIQQNPDSVKIGFNGINDVVDIDSGGIQVNHTDGSYTRMEGGGFKRYVAGAGKMYFSLFYYYPISWSGSKRQTITLPNEFKGKDFKIMCTLNGVTIGGANSTFQDFSLDYLPATVNQTNGTFDVLWTYSNYDSKTMACSGGVYVFA